MLKELLLELDQTDYVSRSNLATKLEQPLAMIDAGLSQLVQMGYLKEEVHEVADCKLSCGGCPYAKSCNQVSLKTMSITEKGQKALAKYKDSY